MNTFIIKKHRVLVLGLLLSSLVFAGCGGSSNGSANSAKSYRVTFNNVTANQPMSPATIIIHKQNYHVWQAGQAASVALEKLAEGGNNQQVLDEAKNNSAFIVSKAGSGVIPPGGSETLELEVGDATGFSLTAAAMLVNTNDAFAGVVSDKIAGLAKGERFSMNIPVWDAGTEANSEASGSLPGPADGGEGFNASRTGDVNFVAIHQGVVTHADGLATSVLDESHRFDNPVGIISVERIN